MAISVQKCRACPCPSPSVTLDVIERHHEARHRQKRQQWLWELGLTGDRWTAENQSGDLDNRKLHVGRGVIARPDINVAVLDRQRRDGRAVVLLDTNSDGEVPDALGLCLEMLPRQP